MPSTLTPADIVAAFPKLRSFTEGMFFAADWGAAELEQSLTSAISEDTLESFVDSNPDALPALSPAGFRLIIGEFLLRAIENPAGEVAIRLALHLEGIRDDQYWHERVRMLSQLQIQTITAYLTVAAERERETSSTSQREAANALAKWRGLTERGLRY